MTRRLLAVLLVSAGCGGEVIEGTGPGQGSTGEPTSGTGEPTTTGATTGTPTTVDPTTGAATTTDPTTAATTTTGEPITTGEPTTGEPAGVCGDGMVDDGEKCDDGNADPLDGCTKACAPPRSCLDLYTDEPTLGDAAYGIDPEGDGSVIEVFCDMMNGGWTQVLRDGLDSTDGWSGGQVSTCGALGGMLGGAGQFGMGATLEKSFLLLNVPHAQVRVHAEFGIIDSWDGEEIFVEVAGQKIAGKTCQYTNAGTCGQTKQECGDPGWNDGNTELIGTTDHPENTLPLLFGSTLNEPAINEAWGLDNLLIFVK
jgi:cysteine-rich repeat protein